MRKGLSRFAVPLLMFVLGIVLLAVSVLDGTGEVHWVLFVPVFTATSIFAFIGTILIIVSIFLFIYIFLRDFTVPYDEDVREGRPGKGAPPSSGTGSPQGGQGPGRKFGGVVLVGPIPVIFGSDARTTKIVIVLAIILMIVAILFMIFYLFMWNP
jgi:uncharacterized membrane protein